MKVTRQSSYMYWAKTASQARFNLATSGVTDLRLADLRFSIDDLALTGGGYGYPPLQEAIAKRYCVAPESIITAAGTSFANHLAMAALINPGDEVLVEHPAYEPMLAVAEYLGANIKRFKRTSDFHILPEEIERSVTPATRLIVITNLHNPSGVLEADETLRQVGEIAKRVNARVLVDEVYIELLFEQQPRTAFHLGTEFVVTSSLTKAFGLSGLRCGWIFAEPELAKQMWLLNDLYAATPVHIGERLSVLAFEQLADLGERARVLLGQNRQLLNAFLDSRNDLDVVRPEFATIVFPRWRGGNADRLCDLLREKYDTTVVPGRYFDMPEHFRVGITGSTEMVSEGLERLGRALDEIGI